MCVAQRPCGTRRHSHSRWQGWPGPGLTALQWEQESRGLLRGEKWGQQVEQQSGPGAFSGVHSETSAPLTSCGRQGETDRPLPSNGCQAGEQARTAV